jgi:hypothetical protein
MSALTARSRPLGQAPGNQGQKTSMLSAARPKRKVTIPPGANSGPMTLYDEYKAAQKKFIINKIIKYAGFICV